MTIMRFTPNTSPTIGVEIELQLIDATERLSEAVPEKVRGVTVVL